MTKSEQKAQKTNTDAEKNGVLGKIEPVEREERLSESHAFATQEQGSEQVEKSLVQATRILLKEYGIRKSAAAVRDAVEMPHKNFMPQHAVSAISSLGFKATFGNI